MKREGNEQFQNYCTKDWVEIDNLESVIHAKNKDLEKDNVIKKNAVATCKKSK